VLIDSIRIPHDVVVAAMEEARIPFP